MHNLTLIIILMLFSTSCSRDSGVHRYKTAKSSAPLVIPELENPVTNPSLNWALPANWKAKEGNSMRLASFEAVTPEGTGDISLIRLGGDGGGLAENINRWRNQVGLEPLENTAAMASGIKHSSKLSPFLYFNIEAGPEENAILASVYTLPKYSLYIKCSGKGQVLKLLEADFILFCESMGAHE